MARRDAGRNRQPHARLTVQRTLSPIRPWRRRTSRPRSQASPRPPRPRWRRCSRHPTRPAEDLGDLALDLGRRADCEQGDRQVACHAGPSGKSALGRPHVGGLERPDVRPAGISGSAMISRRESWLFGDEIRHHALLYAAEDHGLERRPVQLSEGPVRHEAIEPQCSGTMTIGTPVASAERTALPIWSGTMRSIARFNNCGRRMVSIIALRAPRSSSAITSYRARMMPPTIDGRPSSPVTASPAAATPSSHAALAAPASAKTPPTWRLRRQMRTPRRRLGRRPSRCPSRRRRPPAARGRETRAAGTG